MSERPAPIVARVDVLVRRPIHEVFAAFVDLRTEPSYNSGAVTWHVSELEPDKHVAIEGAVGKGTYAWRGDFEEVAGGGTRLTGAIEWQPSRGWGPLRPLLAFALRVRAAAVFRGFARSVAGEERMRPDIIPLAMFVATAALLGVDLVADVRGARHIGIELVAAAAALSGVVLLWARYLRERRGRLLARREAHASRADAERWRESARAAVEGLAAAIDTQFTAWSFTPAERELGFLLLKGLSLKEAAAVLGKSERTVRQQSLGIYRKGGLAGRAELSAFFLEDLLGG